MNKKDPVDLETGDLAWIWSAAGPLSALVIDTDPSREAQTYYLLSCPDREPEWIPESMVFSSPEEVTNLLQPRRVYASLIAHEIVSVQPMPQGCLQFYLDEVESRVKREGE
jgi:hypothetical protein